jgi:hypothetical protein
LKNSLGIKENKIGIIKKNNECCIWGILFLIGVENKERIKIIQKGIVRRTVFKFTKE